MESSWRAGDPWSSVAVVLMRRGRDKHRWKKALWRWDRDKKDVATSQGTSRIPGKHRKAGEKHGRASPSAPLTGTNIIAPFFFPQTKVFTYLLLSHKNTSEETPRVKHSISPTSCSDSSDALWFSEDARKLDAAKVCATLYTRFLIDPVWFSSVFSWSYSVTKSCPTLCDPMDCMQHTRLPCPSVSPGVCSHSCPLSWWCHPNISSLELGLILWPVFFRIHWEIEQLCFCFLARDHLTLKVLWEDTERSKFSCTQGSREVKRGAASTLISDF